jgi:2-polyprenyl-3-methyl-5-hydroxy-6-metoxy-1,4-benzoquinol methylase
MTSISRDVRLGEHYSPRPLSEFVEPSSPNRIDLTVHADKGKDELLAEILKHGKWRHHHGIPELEARSDLYAAYVRRVDEMLSLIRVGLERHGLMETLPNASVCDLAASEGFVSTRLVDWGATMVDAFELSQNGIDRFSLLWNYLGYADKANCRLFDLDLEQVAFANQLPQTYDITFSLGIIYHVESPMLFARNLFAATNDVCVIESDTPTFVNPNRFRENGVVYLNKDQVTVSAGNVRKIMEFRPDREALIDIMLTAGFSTIDVLDPHEYDKNSYFSRGEKSVLLCRK